MKEIRITASKEYEIYIASGGAGFSTALENHRTGNIFVVTDENVHKLHGIFLTSIKDKVIGIKVLKPGESTKNIDAIIDIYNELIKAGGNKKTSILAFGGGVVGDICGFAASTFMRGINLIQMPTTLMAQCDSSIGGKNGFNFNEIKNVIGTFYQPEFVYIDVNLLKTLPEKQYISGLAEIIKYGFVCNKDFFKYLEENKKGIKEREIDKLLHVTHECASIKGKLIELDEYDNDLRQVLNFGHTIGHGFESAGGFRLTHGEAVAIGMIIEGLLSVKLGYLNQGDYKRLVNLIKYFNLPSHIESSYNIERVLEFAGKDKKNLSNDLKFILPDRIGHAIMTTEIKKKLIIEAIRELTEG